MGQQTQYPTAALPATPRQKKAIFAAAKSRDLDIDDVRAMTPENSVSRLTRGQAAGLLDRLNAGRDRPARKRRPKANPDAIRLISPRQRDYIADLVTVLGWSFEKYAAWLAKSLQYESPDQVATSKDAYRVIEGLKNIANRRKGAAT